MGWLKLKRQSPNLPNLEARPPSPTTSTEEYTGPESPAILSSNLLHVKRAIEHVEHARVSSGPATSKTRPFINTQVPTSDLPFIPASEVTAKGTHKGAASGLWIVIDDIVYDCSEFANEHPGGDHVLESFRGAECSWQFWHFRGREHLEEFGRRLRVGRTAGIRNQFGEPPKYVGLKRFGALDDW